MADPNTTPKERIRIFKRDGSAIAEFRANVPRSWVIGTEGRAQFDYSTRKTDIVNEDVLQFGNWLLIENDQLPPWVGVIDTPRTWATRKVTISAYTPEHVFGWRIGPLEEVITGSAGTIFTRLINRVNQAEQTIIRAGSIWYGGPQRQETINPTLLNQNLKQLWENSHEDYAWTPRVGADGRLVVYGKWVPILGEETGALLHEGKGGGNIEAVDRIMIEDGPILNSILAYGDGETWTSRPNVTVKGAGSIGRYGLREVGEEFRSTQSITTLTANATAKLAEFSTPARSFQLNALNVGDTFKYISLGNILKLQLQSVGFGMGGLGFMGRVRIIGMQYDPAMRNKIKLVVREVL